MTTRNLVRDLTPPVLLRFISKVRLVTSRWRRFGYGVEQPSGFYDATYRAALHWKEHYTDSPYYPLWAVVGDRVRRAGVRRVLDIGCGPGQVACFLRDLGVEEYRGLDFSSVRIEAALAACPEYEFVVGNVFENDLLETFDYDCVLMLEFLEHVERDLNVLERIRRGAIVIATVPNFAEAAHVRHFRSIEEVRERYSPLLSTVEVTDFLAAKSGRTHFIVEGIR